MFKQCNVWFFAELGSSTGKMYRMACVSEASAEHRLGADYVSMLTACAAYLWLQPSFLHRLVCQLEENMGQLESDLAKAHAPQSQLNQLLRTPFEQPQ